MVPFVPLRVRPEKVATPAEKVPEVPPAAMEPPAPEIVALAVPEVTDVTTLPAESSTLTTGWVPRTAPEFAVLEGWVLMTNWVAVPKVMVKLPELTDSVPLEKCNE